MRANINKNIVASAVSEEKLPDLEISHIKEETHSKGNYSSIARNKSNFMASAESGDLD